MNRYLQILTLLLTPTVYAGGDHYPIAIVGIEIDGSGFSFSAIPLKQEKAWLDHECQEIHVKGTYDASKWLNYKAPMSAESHQQSLAVLEESFRSKDAIYFGYIGGGLKGISDCSYQSKGLIYEAGKIYSIYTSI